jgi:ATP-binding cassette, subfamily B, bacterial PglK
MLVGTGLEMLGIGLIIPVLALLMEPEVGGRYPVLAPLLTRLGSPSHAALVAGSMVALFCVFAVKAIFLAYLAFRQMRLVYDVQASVSLRLFAGYLRQPWPFHLRRNSAQLVRNTLSETAVFTTSGLMPGLMLISEIFVVVGIVLLLVLVEAVGAFVVGTSLGFVMWAFHRATRRRTLEWGRARQHHEGLRLKHLNEGLGGVKDAKLLGREAEFLESYRIHNEQSARFQRSQSTLLHVPRLVFEVLAVAGLVILVLSMLLQQKPLGTVLPTLALFAAAAFRMMPSMNRIVNAVQSVRYAVPAVETLAAEFRLIDAERPVRSAVQMHFERILELRNVSFTYEGSSKPAIDVVNLAVFRGETIGLIGGSGSGKTTLVDIVLGLLPPQTGTVLVDGVDIGKNPRAWQDLVGYVPQTVFLTDDSLRRNVAFGVAEELIDEAAVDRALRAAQLEEFVAELPDGVQTGVGERGVRLSGGQRQRIGIARALYHDPAVLVLDEATSSLDGSTEESVMQAIQALHGVKTILIVAHRLSTVAACDRLYRMESGCVVDEGETAGVLARFAAGDEREVVGAADLVGSRDRHVQRSLA